MIIKIVLVLLLAIVSFGSGYYYGEGQSRTEVVMVEVPVIFPMYSTCPIRYVDPITIDEGLAIIEMAKATHQLYVDYPEMIRHKYGVTYEEMWVDRYQQLGNLLEGMK